MHSSVLPALSTLSQSSFPLVGLDSFFVHTSSRWTEMPSRSKPRAPWSTQRHSLFPSSLLLPLTPLSCLQTLLTGLITDSIVFFKINTNSHSLLIYANLILKKITEKNLCTDLAPPDTKNSNLPCWVIEKGPLYNSPLEIIAAPRTLPGGYLEQQNGYGDLTSLGKESYSQEKEGRTI